VHKSAAMITNAPAVYPEVLVMRSKNAHRANASMHSSATASAPKVSAVAYSPRRWRGIAPPAAVRVTRPSTPARAPVPRSLQVHTAKTRAAIPTSRAPRPRTTFCAERGDSSTDEVGAGFAGVGPSGAGLAGVA